MKENKPLPKATRRGRAYHAIAAKNPYFFVVGVFLIVISPYALSDGMFMDGLFYATIAKNLTEGLGSFWDLHFTATCSPHFRGHPPFAFGVQSIFYTLLGDSKYIDKIYSLFTYVVAGYLILKIWQHLKLKSGWIALLLWLLTPVVFWASTNNMLENTLTIFVLLSALFILKYQDGKGLPFLILSGLMLSIGFLTKGFVAFFVWTFPFVLWLIKREQPFRKMALATGVVVLVTLGLLFSLFLLPEARENILTYLNGQVANSLKNVRTVDTRFFIVKRFFCELLVAICICLFVVFWAKMKKCSMKLMRTNLQPFLIFFIVGLTGVVPVMVSAKQSGFYILATYPFFAIALGALLEPLISYLRANIKGSLMLNLAGYVVFFVGVCLCFYFSTTMGRDENKIKDTYQILKVVPKRSLISIPPTMYEDWGLHGYYARYGAVSLDSSGKRDYLLVKRNYPIEESFLNGYLEVDVQTVEYKLYKRINH
jgi:4-amino-4-deoxy-L-arabinose transferase-like glycosyltransferase